MTISDRITERLSVIQRGCYARCVTKEFVVRCAKNALITGSCVRSTEPDWGWSKNGICYDLGYTVVSAKRIGSKRLKNPTIEVTISRDAECISIFRRGNSHSWVRRRTMTMNIPASAIREV